MPLLRTWALRILRGGEEGPEKIPYRLFDFSKSFKTHSRTLPPTFDGLWSYLAKQSLKLLGNFLALSIASRCEQGQDSLLISAWN